MQNKKFLKVMFGTTSGANSNVKYKLNNVTIADVWNPQAENPTDMGGFNFSTEDKILRWLVRGDTIYDVEIPEDAEIIDCPNESAPHGVFRANKIIISNPRPVTDELAMNFYLKSDLPEKSYYKSLAGCAIRGYKNTCLQIIKDKVNQSNIDLVLSEWNDFHRPGHCNENGNIDVDNEMMKYLNEIKSDLLISRFVDKDPFIKDLTDDKVINITGESGSGKSYFTKKYINDDNYIVIDTDVVFGNGKFDNKENLEIRELFKNKDKNALITDFDNCYLEILNYFKDTDKTIVIDSAQYRNIKDPSILKGQIIVMRTSIETCYDRCIKRWKENNKNYTKEEYEKYANKKSKMFEWYKSLNDFLEVIDQME